MLGVLNIVNKYFWKSWSGPFFTFIITPLIMLLTMAMLPVPTVLQANALSLPIICTGLTVVPSTIFEFKNSAILKRIGVANVKPFMFIIAIIIYFTAFMILSTILNLIFAMIYIRVQFGTDRTFGGIDFYSAYHSADYGAWAYVQIVVIILSLSLGFMSASIFRSVLAIQTFGIATIMITMFLGGTFASLTLVEKLPVLNWFSYLLPYRYTSTLSTEAWFSDVEQLMKKYPIELHPELDRELLTQYTANIAVLKWLMNSPYSDNFALGSFDKNGVFQEISFEKLVPPFPVGANEGGALRPCEVTVTFFDNGKGFVYQTTFQKIIDANEKMLTLEPHTSLFNFYRNRIWDLNDHFAQIGAKISTNVRQVLPQIVSISSTTRKILSLAMPYVFTIISFGIAAINFRWNSR